MTWLKTKSNSWLFKFVNVMWGSFFALFYRHKVYGLENFIPGGAIIAANHTSFLDPPLVSTSCPEEIHFLARKTLFRNPIFGYFIRKLNSHPVSGSGADAATFRTVLKLLQEGKKVLVFPEGQRTYGKIGEIRGGLGLLSTKSQKPIIPVYIHGTSKILGRGKYFPKLWGRTSVTFSTPIDPKDFSHLGKKEAIDAISKRFEQTLKAMETNCTKTQP